MNDECSYDINMEPDSSTDDQSVTEVANLVREVERLRALMEERGRKAQRQRERLEKEVEKWKAAARMQARNKEELLQQVVKGARKRRALEKELAV